MKINIKFKFKSGKKVKLNDTEARELYNRLHTIYGTDRYWSWWNTKPYYTFTAQSDTTINPNWNTISSGSSWEDVMSYASTTVDYDIKKVEES